MSEEIKTEALEFARANPLVHLATVQGDQPHLRAMHAAKIGDDFSLFFATHRSSGKIGQVKENPKVCVSFLREQQDLRVFGEAELVDTKEAREDIWHERFNFAFPGGVDDPELIVLKIRPGKRIYRNIPKFGMVPTEF